MFQSSVPLLEKVKDIVYFLWSVSLYVLGSLRNRLEPSELLGELAAMPGGNSSVEEPIKVHRRNQK